MNIQTVSITAVEAGANEVIAVLCASNGGADLSAVEDGIINRSHGGGGVDVTSKENVSTHAGSAGGVRVIGMGAVDHDFQNPTKAAEHIGFPHDLLSGEGQGEADDVDEIPLDEASVLEICHRLHLACLCGDCALGLEDLLLRAALALLLSRRPLLGLLDGGLGADLLEGEILLLVRGAARGAQAIQILTDVIQTPAADDVRAAAWLHGAVGGVEVLETQWARRDVWVLHIGRRA